jgi:DinB superfamily
MSRVEDAPVAVYLEIGPKRTFAGAVEWPGWCRIGRDEAGALQALADHGPRFASVLRSAGIPFPGVRDAADLLVVERLAGDATTDFGAPGKAPSVDDRPLSDPELHRLRAILVACWAAFDREVGRASGKELRKGPRGGGRDLESIVQHVLAAESAYVSKLGGKVPANDEPPAADGALADGVSAIGAALAADGDPSAGRVPVTGSVQDADPVARTRDRLRRSRAAAIEAIDAAAHGIMMPLGPRGGSRWSARYAVRRMAWHVLDHAWEIEDRATT